MKKTISLIAGIMLLFSLGLVAAAQGPADGTGVEHDSVIAAGGQDGNPTPGEGIGVMVQDGTHIGQGGQMFKVQAQANNRIRLEVGGTFADCECDMTQEEFENRTRLYTQMSNGRNAEIKVMPDAASETALQRLRLQNCDGECQIELREVGSGQNARLAYEMRTQRQSKVFGLFGARMQVQAQVDAETGEVIRVNKPWWAFLASEPAEEAE